MKIRQESRFNKKALWIIGAILAAFAVIFGSIAVAGLGYYNSVRNDAIEWEGKLNTQYKVNQNSLSTYALKFNDSLGLADREAEKVSTILVDAISGRYTETDLLSGSEEGPLFAAVQEAYPDTSNVSEAYRLVQEAALSGREEYAQEQDKLMNLIEGYNVWMNSGLLRSQVVDFGGFPSDNLQARVGDDVYKGEEALEKMGQLVQTEESIEAYDSGIIESMIDPED